MLYVVDYPDHKRPDGFAFTVFVTDYDGHQDFNIQNNARFTLHSQESSYRFRATR